MTASDEFASPAVQGRLLRTTLREARDKSGLSQEQVAGKLDISLSKVVRIESGASKISTNDLRAMLALYQISEPGHVEELVNMAKAARQPPWWRDYSGIASRAYLEFVEFEQTATETWHYQPLWVPGVLQTESYAREIIRCLGPDSDQGQQDLFDFRMKRQKILSVPQPPSLQFVLDESVLLRQVGSQEIMARQLEQLTELASHHAVTIHLRPFNQGLVRRMQAPFVIHRLAEAGNINVLYQELPAGDTLVQGDARVIHEHCVAFDELKRTSLSPAESVAFIKEVAASLG